MFAWLSHTFWNTGALWTGRIILIILLLAVALAVLALLAYTLARIVLTARFRRADSKLRKEMDRGEALIHRDIKTILQKEKVRIKWGEFKGDKYDRIEQAFIPENVIYVARPFWPVLEIVALCADPEMGPVARTIVEQKIDPDIETSFLDLDFVLGDIQRELESKNLWGKGKTVAKIAHLRFKDEPVFEHLLQCHNLYTDGQRLVNDYRRDMER